MEPRPLQRVCRTYMLVVVAAIVFTLGNFAISLLPAGVPIDSLIQSIASGIASLANLLTLVVGIVLCGICRREPPGSPADPSTLTWIAAINLTFSLFLIPAVR
jgi:hypothetical protein